MASPRPTQKFDRLTAAELHELRRQSTRHLKNLEEIQLGKDKYRNWKTIDNKEPRTLQMTHVKFRHVKRKQEERFRQREIQRENVRLLERMSQILRKGGHLGAPKKVTGPQSAREKIRKLNSQAIEQENKRLKRRIKTTQPVYSSSAWAKEYRTNEIYIRNLSYFQRAKRSATAAGPTPGAAPGASASTTAKSSSVRARSTSPKRPSMVETAFGEERSGILERALESPAKASVSARSPIRVPRRPATSARRPARRRPGRSPKRRRKPAGSSGGGGGSAGATVCSSPSQGMLKAETPKAERPGDHDHHGGDSDGGGGGGEQIRGLGVQPEPGPARPAAGLSAAGGAKLSVDEMHANFEETLEANASSDVIAQEMRSAFDEHDSDKQWQERERKRLNIKGRKAGPKSGNPLPESIVRKRAIRSPDGPLLCRMAWIGSRKEIELSVRAPRTGEVARFALLRSQVKTVAKQYAKHKSRGSLARLMDFSWQHLRLSRDASTGTAMTASLAFPAGAASARNASARNASARHGPVVQVRLKPIRRERQLVLRFDAVIAMRPVSSQAVATLVLNAMAARGLDRLSCRPVQATIEWEHEQRRLRLLLDIEDEGQQELVIGLGPTEAHSVVEQERELSHVVQCIKSLI